MNIEYVFRIIVTYLNHKFIYTLQYIIIKPFRNNQNEDIDRIIGLFLNYFQNVLERYSVASTSLQRS